LANDDEWGGDDVMLSMLVAAAKPWTYWIAPPLLVATVLALLAVATVYYRKVVAPSYALMLEEQRQRVARLRPSAPSSIPGRAGVERPRAQAA
jgi:hypothetical protein